MNATMLDDLGFSEDEVLGKKKPEDLLTVGSKIFFQTHFYPLIKIQKNATEIFLSFLSRDKADIPVLLNVVLDQTDNINFEIHCGGMQISRRNRFEKELLEDKRNAQKALAENVELVEMRKQLLSAQQALELQLRNASGKYVDQTELNKVLSHDLQEPLRKISLYSSRLTSYEDSGLSANHVEILNKIAALASTVRKLLDSLEKLNSLNSKRIQIAPVDLPEVIDAVKKYSQSLPETIQIAFSDKVIGGKQEAAFNSDAKLISDLFKELIVNTVRFKDPEIEIVKIQISTDIVKENIFTQIKGKYRYQQYLRIRFENNGIADLYTETNAFELFRRSGSQIELGIGLAYCRRIVQLLDGKISVSSKKDAGSTFNILLPLNHR